MNANNMNELQPLVQEKEINLREYWSVLMRRKWTVVTCALLVLVAAGLWTFLSKPVYTAKGTMLIEKEPNILAFEDIFQIETLRDDYYQTQYKLLQSRALAAAVIERLKLDRNPEFTGKKPESVKGAERKDGAGAGTAAAGTVQTGFVNRFLGSLQVKPVRMTRLVEVSFSSGDPELAALGVNTLFDTFIDMSVEARFEATEQATIFISQQIETLRREAARMESELQTYGAEKNIVPLSDTETTILDKLGEVNRALTAAQIEFSNKKAYYEGVKNASPDFVPETMRNPLILRLREDYVRLSREYAKKQESFHPEYPEMQRLKTELESAKTLLQNETQNFVMGAYSEYQAAQKKVESLQSVFDRQKSEAFTLNSNAIAYNSLKIEIQNKKNLLESLMRRQSETGVSARLRGLRTSNARVVDRAEVPTAPSSPKKKRNMLLALLLGLAGGLGLAFFFEHLDNSVKTTDDVEKNSGLPTLGIVPSFGPNGAGGRYGYGYGHGRVGKDMHIRIVSQKPKRALPIEVRTGMGLGPGEEEGGGAGAAFGARGDGASSIELIAHTSPKSNYAECYRSVRTSILLSGAEADLKSLLITSPLPAEGKTITVSNLAVSLAQMNKRVVLVDADLRKPRLHRLFKIKNTGGLTKYLTGGAGVKDVVRTTDVPNLSLVNSGALPPNPAELLGGERMAALVKALREQHNYILFDTPPVLVVTDAMVLGQVVDGVVLVVQGDKTPVEALKRAKESLDMLKVRSLGVIINNLNMKRHSYYYKHYYKSYGHYGEA